MVMVQLEPRAEKEPRSLKQYKKETKDKNTNKKTKTKSAMQRNFLTISRKHVAIGKGLMAAHAHDIRLKVRRKRSNIIGK